VPGADLPGVHYLRTLDDSDALRAAFRPGANVVVIGGGWIGLETAAAARTAGATVTVLESAELPLLRVLGPQMAQVFAGLHRENGVDLRLGVTVAAVRGDGAAVTGVELGDGVVVDADAVVVGVGVTPNVDLARQAGLDVDDGVLVNASLRTSDARVFAVGDVANAEHPVLGRRIRVEHWANALHQPEVAAKSILGQDAVYDRLPYFFTDQYDLGMEYVGYASADDDVVVRGDLEGREFVALWVRDGRVVAGMNVNIWDVTDRIRDLILAEAPADAFELPAPSA
jgi:3-phenylpropionate/trans-cinnamate dioxygenase ferredoxin reductase subunit